MRSFAERDLPLTSRLKERDYVLDQMNDDFAERVTEVMPHHVDMIPSYVEMVAKLSQAYWQLTGN